MAVCSMEIFIIVIFFIIEIAILLILAYIKKGKASLIELFKFIKEQIKVFIGQEKEKQATILATVVIVLVCIMLSIITHNIHRPPVNVNNIIINEVTDTVASFDIQADRNNVKWYIYLVYADNSTKKVDDGNGENGYTEKLMPELKYEIKVKGTNKSQEFRTTASREVSDPYLECTEINKFDPDNIRITLHNNGKRTIRGEITYVLTDSNEDCIHIGNKYLILAGSKDKTISVKNRADVKNVKIYYNKKPILGN